MKLQKTNFPKLDCPFVRENVDGKYIVVAKINPGYEWVFGADTVAVDKLHGSNFSILVKSNEIVEILNRENKIIWYKERRFAEGFIESIERGYFDIKKVADGRYFGELVGPKMNANPYNMPIHIWVPFDYIKEKYTLRYMNKEIMPQLDAGDAKKSFEVLDTFMQNFWSPFSRKWNPDLDNNAVDKDTKSYINNAGEGLIFYNTKTGQMAKLRRDMYNWYKGQTHGH